MLNLNIKEIKYDKNIKLDNISEYEFELVKIIATMEDGQKIEMYLKMIKSTRIKESIFCYWCSVFEEELQKVKEIENTEMIINKVLISELDETKHKKSIFLSIENNKTKILETGTEVNFLNINDYIEEQKNDTNQYQKISEFFDKQKDEVLLVGLKINRKNGNT